MLLKRYLEKVHAKDTPLDRAWTIVEFLENEARVYITNKSGAERDTDEKTFALLAGRFGTGSSKIHTQQLIRTRNQTSDEDYMQYLDALEGLRSQDFPIEEVAVRRYEKEQKFIDGVRNFELKRNLALMYAQENYVEEPPTLEKLIITVQQNLRMRGSVRTDHYQAAPQQPAPPQNQPNPVQHQTFSPPVHNAQQVPPQLVAYRQQRPRACLSCSDPSHFVADCPLKDRAQKPMQKLIILCRTNPVGEWNCPSNPYDVNKDIVPAALPVHGTVTFCINCGRTGHAAS